MYYEDNDTKKKKKNKSKKINPAETVITLIIIVITIISVVIVVKTMTGKNAPVVKAPEESVSSNIEDDEVDETVSDDAAIEQEVEETLVEDKKPVYKDLTLDEAWEIARANGVTMNVTSGTVNVRQAPTTESEKVGMVKENSTVYIICEEDTGDGYTWCYVIYDKAASDTGTDSQGNTMITIENKHHLGYIRKDLLK